MYLQMEEVGCNRIRIYKLWNRILNPNQSIYIIDKFGNRRSDPWKLEHSFYKSIDTVI
jgi:hypothetical protein